VGPDGTLGLLILLQIFDLWVLTLHLVCSQTKCTVRTHSTNLKSYENLRTPCAVRLRDQPVWRRGADQVALIMRVPPKDE